MSTVTCTAGGSVCSRIGPVKDLVVAATFSDVAQAELARERLGLEGIQSFVFDQQTGGVMPYMVGSLGGIRLEVAPGDLEKAKEILGS
jgi:hypothetical protein